MLVRLRLLAHERITLRRKNKEIEFFDALVARFESLASIDDVMYRCESA